MSEWNALAGGDDAAASIGLWWTGDGLTVMCWALTGFRGLS
jgi:hypothetical protein